MQVNTAVIANLYWKEKHHNKDGTINNSADYQSYSICGCPDSIHQIYWMLKQTKRLWYLELSYNGCSVARDGSDGLFPWFQGDLNGT